MTYAKGRCLTHNRLYDETCSECASDLEDELELAEEEIVTLKEQLTQLKRYSGHTAECAVDLETHIFQSLVDNNFLCGQCNLTKKHKIHTGQRKCDCGWAKLEVK